MAFIIFIIVSAFFGFYISLRLKVRNFVLILALIPGVTYVLISIYYFNIGIPVPAKNLLIGGVGLLGFGSKIFVRRE